MITYFQRTNRNSFTLKYKKYKKLRSDLWGHIAFVNKINKFTNQMKSYAYQDLKNLTRRLHYRKRKQVYRTFGLIKGFYEPFIYSITDKPEPKRKKKLQTKSFIVTLKKKIQAFYHLRLRRKSLRKLFKTRTVQRLYNSPIKPRGSNQIKFMTTPAIRGSSGSQLESRFDVSLYRLNFISSIYEGRRIIKTKKAFVLGPCQRRRIYRKFFIYSHIKKHYYKIPLFYFISLRYDLSLIRKVYLKNLIYAFKLLVYPPDYFMVNYKSMIGLRLENPQPQKVRYPFHGTLAFFIGTALYF